MTRAWLLAILFLAGCASTPRVPASLQPTVLLISFDGMRWDYPEKADTPNFHAIAAEGVRAKSLVSIFPSMTFPNHYTIVTGLYAERHGIVNNDMYDPKLERRFHIKDLKEVNNPEWWGGEPLWVTAQKQGQRSASMFWVGSSTPIGGLTPTYWVPYDKKMPKSERVRRILDWLDLPEKERPTFLTLYFDDADTQGHSYGPDSEQVKKAIGDVDKAIGELLDGLKSRGLLEQINIILVSDHGMSEIPASQNIPLAKYLPEGKAEVAGSGAIVGLFPRGGTSPAELVKRLAKAHPHMHAYLKEKLPERYHYKDNRRIAPVQLISDEGWYILRSDSVPMRGAHGWDPELKTMQGILFARGPAFRRGAGVDSVQNVHLYALMARLLSLKPAPNDGNADALNALLKETP